MKKLLTILLLVALVFSACPVAFADDSGIMPCYDYICMINLYFDIKGGVAMCAGQAFGEKSDTKTEIRVTLRKRAIGETAWQYVDAWTDTADGKGSAYVSKDISVPKGYDYRLGVRCRIFNSSGAVVESDTMYSDIIRY